MKEVENIGMIAQTQAVEIERLLRENYSKDGARSDAIRKNPYKYIEEALRVYLADRPEKKEAIKLYQSKYMGLINNSLDALIETGDADDMIFELRMLFR